MLTEGGGGAGRVYRERKWGKILMKRKGEVQFIHAGHEREREEREEREKEKKKKKSARLSAGI